MVTPLTPAEFAYLDAYQIENWNLTRGPTIKDLGVFIEGNPQHLWGVFQVFLWALQEEWRANPPRPTFEDWEYTPIALKAPPRPWVTVEEFEARGKTLKIFLDDLDRKKKAAN